MNQWQLDIQEGKWQDAIAELENIEIVDPTKEAWSKKMKAWI